MKTILARTASLSLLERASLLTLIAGFILFPGALLVLVIPAALLLVLLVARWALNGLDKLRGGDGTVANDNDY